MRTQEEIDREEEERRAAPDAGAAGAARRRRSRAAGAGAAEPPPAARPGCSMPAWRAGCAAGRAAAAADAAADLRARRAQGGPQRALPVRLGQEVQALSRRARPRSVSAGPLAPCT